MTRVNLQTIEKPNLSIDGLDVVDVWKTIQGEGPFVGIPAVFVRLAGCNLQCPGCDTDYTSNRKYHQTHELAARVRDLAGKGLVVMTGGEPMRQNIAPFVRDLLYGGEHHVQIETNGTLFVPDLPWFGEFTVVCSPKTPKVNTNLVEFIKFYKYILKAEEVNHFDGLPTSSLNTGVAPARPPRKFRPCDVFVQPMDEGEPEANQRNMQAALDSCMKFGYRMCLQTHKILGVP